MNLIVCLDQRNGMLFGGRRQSMDRLLRQRMLQVVGDKKLWINSYTARQFETLPETVVVDNSFLLNAALDDYCFVENGDLEVAISKAHKVIIYRWDRIYPSDVTFPVQILNDRNKISEYKFQGFSHKEITEEVYV